MAAAAATRRRGELSVSEAWDDGELEDEGDDDDDLELGDDGEAWDDDEEGV